MIDQIIIEIQNETNFIDYINKLCLLQGYTIIISVKDIMGRFLGEDGVNALEKLGCTRVCIKKDPDWRSYVAIIKNQEVIIEKDGICHDSVNICKEIGKNKYDILSAPFYTGNFASIIINDMEYSTNGRGFNFVIVNESGDVIDSVAFDTNVKERTCIRNNLYRKTIIIGRKKSQLVSRVPGEIRGRLNLSSIIREDYMANKRIKVRFFVWGSGELWNAVDSVIQSFKKDTRFDCAIVLYYDNVELIKLAGLSGLRVFLDRHYKIEEDKPDIAYFNKARSYYKNFASIQYKVAVEAGLINGIMDNFNIDALIKEICDKDVDAILVEKHIYKIINDNGRNKEGIWHNFGNPKFDDIFYGKNRGESREESMKIVGRTTILWAFDHNWTLNDCTFDLYINACIDFFEKNTNFALIIRPHPQFIREMINSKVWSRNEFEVLKEYINGFDNIVWDDCPSYKWAFSVADGLITDINCGIILSGTVLDIPIGITHRYDGGECQPIFSQINECHYQIFNEDDLYSFFKMVGMQDDSKKAERNAIADQYITHFDGKNGQRIKDFIVEEYFKKIKLLEEKEKAEDTIAPTE